MLGDKRGKGEGVASGLRYFGEHISSFQHSVPMPSLPRRCSHTLELHESWRNHQLLLLLGCTSGPAKSLPCSAG